MHPYCFSFAILDKEKNQIVEFESTLLEIGARDFLTYDSISKWFITHHEIFNLPYRCSKVSIHSPEFTVLPEKTEKPKEIFNLLGFGQREDITYLKNKIHSSFYVYFALQDKTINFIENHLPNVEFYCSDFGLLHFYNQKLSNKNYLAGNIYGDELSICSKSENGNNYYNKFIIKSKEDLLYYFKLAYDQLGLNTDEYPAYLYGFIEEKSPMYSTSYGYIRNFEIDRTLKNTLPLLVGVEDIPLHYYINLLGLGI